ncbi:SIMPL domain-containing protein [Pseudoflavitalea sp. X16]|uniref:SIMPL domain-containing protein n=1 Tax=Paraflavitalea devenefica TaxID=2716334 RepID=UPI00141F303F|nr:SIMPL domain-containing protein [Paraflavitalea devenefica]NII25699.1 SIMPL domain-containing protein [Paraflavitalea devenefica]
MKKFIPVCLIALTSLTGFAQSTAVNPYPKTITVNGSAQMEVVPDEIYVIVDLKEYEKKGSGKINLEKIKSDFLASCRSIGLPDSVITIASYDGYNGNPWIRKRSKKQELMAFISYQVKFTNSKKMDELVEKLDDDATQNFRIERTSHSKIQEYRKQLKIQAIKAAKEKAGYLAAAIDEQVGAAVTIQEPNDQGIIPYENQRMVQYNLAMDSAKMGGSEASMDFRKITLKFEVNVVFALK